jgi:hypothetical protein
MHAYSYWAGSDGSPLPSIGCTFTAGSGCSVSILLTVQQRSRVESVVQQHDALYRSFAYAFKSSLINRPGLLLGGSGQLQTDLYGLKDVKPRTTANTHHAVLVWWPTSTSRALLHLLDERTSPKHEAQNSVTLETIWIASFRIASFRIASFDLMRLGILLCRDKSGTGKRHRRVS